MIVASSYPKKMKFWRNWPTKAFVSWAVLLIPVRHRRRKLTLFCSSSPSAIVPLAVCPVFLKSRRRLHTRAASFNIWNWGLPRPPVWFLSRDLNLILTKHKWIIFTHRKNTHYLSPIPTSPGYNTANQSNTSGLFMENKQLNKTNTSKRTMELTLPTSQSLLGPILTYACMGPTAMRRLATFQIKSRMRSNVP